MQYALAGMADRGSLFYVLPRNFGAAGIGEKWGLKMGDEELVTYAMVGVRVLLVVRVLCCSGGGWGGGSGVVQIFGCVAFGQLFAPVCAT